MLCATGSRQIGDQPKTYLTLNKGQTKGEIDNMAHALCNRTLPCLACLYATIKVGHAWNQKDSFWYRPEKGFAEDLDFYLTHHLALSPRKDLCDKAKRSLASFCRFEKHVSRFEIWSLRCQLPAYLGGWPWFGYYHNWKMFVGDSKNVGWALSRSLVQNAFTVKGLCIFPSQTLPKSSFWA